MFGFLKKKKKNPKPFTHHMNLGISGDWNAF